MQKDHGCRAVITFKNGDTLVDEIDVPNAHPRGTKPFGREDYIRKFLKLSDGIVCRAEADRFLHLVHRLPDLSANDLGQLNVEADPALLRVSDTTAIF